MANKTTSSTWSAANLVSCINCLHAQLHRYDSNPILASCHCKPQPNNERFPYVVEVAAPLRKCKNWALDPRKKEVEQRTRVA